MEIRKPASTLIEAYNYLDPNEPLSGEEHPFYVPRPPRFGPGLLQEALEASSPKDKLLFSGSRGSGKSTELLRLSSQLGEKRLIVLVNLEAILDLGDVDYRDVLLAIGEKIVEGAWKRKISIDSKPLEELKSWYQKVFFEKERIAGVEVEAAGSFLGFITARLRGGPTVRQTVRKEVEHRLSEFLDLLERLVKEVESKMGKSLIVLVDGLDKVYDLEKAVKVFRDGAGALIAPSCTIVYTVPHVLLYDSTLGSVLAAFRSHYSLPNISPFNRDGSRCEEGWETLDAILRKRVEEKLLPEEAREKIISLSGGVLKHLLTLAGEAILQAMHRRHEAVTVEDVEQVEYRNRMALSPVFTSDQRKILKQVAKERAFDNSEEARNLAMNLHILNYVDLERREEWWDVHPLLRPLLERW